MLNLNIAYPPTPTRFGYNSANTIDIALIKNFYYPFTINSIDDLSSDHNPVFLNFSFKLAIEPPNPRAVSTDWYSFKNNLNNNLSLFDYHPNDINNTNDLEQKISEFTDAVIETHSHASRPIEIDKRNFTPLHINRLLKLKNHLRKRYHQTLNPIFKTYYNRAQSDFKKELKKYNDDIWQKRLEALNTTDNSLWRTQKFFKNKRSKIPSLNCATGTAVTDQQKANLLATNLKNNFIENERENDSYNHNDENINSTVNNFLSTPPTTNIEPALPDEIIHYIKHINSKKAPGKDLITNRMLKNFPIKLILILTILVNKILKFNHFPENWKEAIIFPINKPGKDPHLATSYRPISLLSTIGKLTESIILLRLKNFINSNNLLNPNQYGFTTNLSTLHPLLRLTEHISEGFQKKKSTGAVFLDIQKAFDRVWINGLTFKLISYNIPPPMIHLIHSYLTNRSFKEIKLKETIPLPAFVSSGKIATDLPQMGLEEILYYHRHYSKSIDELTALENRTVQQNCNEVLTNIPAVRYGLENEDYVRHTVQQLANSLKLATQEVIISFLWVNNVSTSAMSRQHVKSCRSSQSGRQDVESRNMARSGLPSSLMTEITTARIGEMI
ncbi:probable RNA-directed DNA polymerase from transposon BS [Trichonephila clavipes]|nr:probable RNA-directed DNA polymerase from transposon BS [Trichonephila clavipes]